MIGIVIVRGPTFFCRFDREHIIKVTMVHDCISVATRYGIEVIDLDPSTHHDLPEDEYAPALEDMWRDLTALEAPREFGAVRISVWTLELSPDKTAHWTNTLCDADGYPE